MTIKMKLSSSCFYYMKFIVPFYLTLFITSTVLAQQNVSFDMISFNEPANWTFTDNGSYHAYATVNNSTKAFCIISVYSSDASSGNMNEDFRKEWDGIVAGHFTVTKNPKPQQNASAGGVNYLQEESNVSNNQGTYFARLLLFDLKGKIQPVLFLTGNQNMLSLYQSDLDHFTASIQPNKSTNTNTQQSTNTLSSGASHFNHFIFNVPAGWKSMQQSAFFSITAPDLQSDEILFYLLLPPVNDTGFNTTAENTLNLVAQSMGGKASQEQIFGKGPIYILENEGKYAKGWEYSMGHGRILVNTTPNDPIVHYINYHAGVFLVKLHSRIERVVYISKDLRRGLEENSTYRKPSYESIIKNFFFDLEFDDWTDSKSTPGKVTNTSISALWGGLAYFEGSLGKTFFEGSVKTTYLVFFDNGQVYYNKELPKEGLRNINTYTQAALYPRWWGTYTYQNGSGTIKLSYATIPFTLKEGKIYLDIYQSKIPYVQSSSFDGIQLNGNWCEQSEYNGKKACIAFTGTGQFTDNGIIKRIEHEINNCFHTIPESGQGTYEIKSNAIVFHYNNGFIYQAAFSGLNLQKSNPSPNEIHLGYNDDVFTKQ